MTCTTKTKALERLMRSGIKVIDKWVSCNGSRFKAWRIVG
jgi:hypothetical protein